MDTLRHCHAPRGPKPPICISSSARDQAQTPPAAADPAQAPGERPRQFATVEFANELPADVLARLRETNPYVSSGLAIGCHLSIAAIAAGVIALFHVNGPFAVACYPLAAAVIARQQRGLELLVHDGSHMAWCRGKPKVNNRLANLLAAYPSFTDVDQYWQFHKVHHARYGSTEDPCKRRFESMRAGLEPGGRAKAMLSYTAGWYREAARKPAALARAAAWHLCVFLVPLGLTLGWSTAALAWALFWAVPQFLALPWLRFVAELEEHDYSDGQSEATGTFTNVGWLHAWLVHPMKDGYHLIHHAFPSVPQWKHKTLHRLLMNASPKYRASRARTELLGPSTNLRDID